MPGLCDWLTWWKMGRPSTGSICFHHHHSYTFEDGVEVPQRLTKRFGDLSKLACVDLGAGPAETVIAQQILDIPWRRLTSVEAYTPYVERLREKKARTPEREILQINIGEIFNTFAPQHFDVALLIDVFEHFPRAQALDLILKLEKFVSRGVVIFTPIGHVEQEDLDGNPLQRHLSFWQSKDLARLGYQVDEYSRLHGGLTPPASAFWAIKTTS